MSCFIRFHLAIIRYFPRGRSFQQRLACSEVIYLFISLCVIVISLFHATTQRDERPEIRNKNQATTPPLLQPNTPSPPPSPSPEVPHDSVRLRVGGGPARAAVEELHDDVEGVRRQVVDKRVVAIPAATPAAAELRK